MIADFPAEEWARPDAAARDRHARVPRLALSTGRRSDADATAEKTIGGVRVQLERGIEGGKEAMLRSR